MATACSLSDILATALRLLVGMFGSGTVLALVPDWRVLAFTAGVSLTTGILFGLFPALQTLRLHVSPALKDAGRATVEANAKFGLGKGDHLNPEALGQIAVQSVTVIRFVADQSRREGVEETVPVEPSTSRFHAAKRFRW